MTERLGPMLRALRVSREALIRRYCGGEYRWIMMPLSQNELARRAGIHAAYVNRCEAGVCVPRRAIVGRLADALECDALDRARLLVAAGYWPWPTTDADAAVTDLAVATALAVMAGDYRPLESATRPRWP